ncbi:Cof-type HAD-IIB family hydrolase [Bifidobacterium thermophilum]|uniref:Cof-type HAD-IIB family hydrolase n=1 Tax=Bifidobacterium thermophilum TaxID=33905 RepID=UPI003995A182
MSATRWTASTPLDGDISMVVADMDGTLLDGDSSIPEGFWPLLERMQQAGIEFVPASGRQIFTLRDMFGEAMPSGSFIAENGNLVVAQGHTVSVTALPAHAVAQMIGLLAGADLPQGHDVGMVVCGEHSAYTNRKDTPFVDECRKYYHRLAFLDDLHEAVMGSHADRILKVAVFDFGDVRVPADTLFAPLRDCYQVVVSGAHWVDIMDARTDKRRGVVALQEQLGITPAQTMVFGDYLNDLQMLGAGEWSFAMANAYPDLLREARYIAPANTEYGVLRIIDAMLRQRESRRRHDDAAN